MCNGYTVRVIGNQVYIDHEYTHENEPKKTIHRWYAAAIHRSPFFCADPGDGDRITSIDRSGEFNALGYSVYIQGDQKSEIVGVYAIPRPKTKLETKWINGSWHKLLKKGWVKCTV